MQDDFQGFERGTIPIPKCPICENECDSFYRNGFDNVIGCENCIEKVDSYVEEWFSWNGKFKV